MDPLTQGVVGAVLPQATAARGRFAASAGLLGFLAGMAADLDVLIRSSEDPLLFLEYHRQFTHSLVFIPLGGLICALVLHGIIGRRRGLKFRQSWLFCSLGYATHALLDACTTYGTMLFWPFSDARIAWNTISRASADCLYYASRCAKGPGGPGGERAIPVLFLQGLQLVVEVSHGVILSAAPGRMF